MKITSYRIHWILFLFVFTFAFSCGDDNPIVIIPNPGGDEFYDEAFKNVPAVNDIIMYEANERVFAKSNSLQAVKNRLDEIKSLGVNVLWLMPVTEQGTLNAFGSPYCVKNYKKVEPEYGTLEDLRTLVKEAHNRDMAVIVDWVANHTSWDNNWLSLHPDWYTRDANGNVGPPAGTNWNDVVDLDYDNQSLRKEMIECMKYWIREANIDGYRCDAADWVPSDFWNSAISELRKMQTGRTILMLAEGTSTDNIKVGFDLDYGWSFYGALEGLYKGTSSVSNLYRTHESEFAKIPSGKQKLRFMTNHDYASENSPTKVFTNQRGAMSAFVISSTLGGVPLIYSSQEIGYSSTINFFQYNSMDWNSNSNILAEYKKIMKIHAENKAFKSTQLQTFETNNDVVHFYRYDGDSKVYTIVNVRNAAKTLSIPAAQRGSWINLMDNSSVTLGDNLNLQAYEYYILSK